MGQPQLRENSILLFQTILLKVSESNHKPFAPLKLLLKLVLGAEM